MSRGQDAGRWVVLNLCRRVPVSGLLVLATCGIAVAAEVPAKGPSEAVFVAQLVLLLLVGRLFGEAMQRLGQPAVVGQLLAGIVLGPSVFGALLPSLYGMVFPSDHAQKAMIDGVAQIGVLLLLLLTGMETDVALVRRTGRASLSVSVTGIAVPFVCGFALGMFVLPDSMLPAPERRMITSLFLGTALSISSIKIVAMVVREMNFMRRNLGQVIVASAIIDDTIGWIIVAITFGLARPGGLDARSLGISVGGTLLFIGLSYTVGRRIVSTLIRWANDNLKSEFPVITAILVAMGIMALITDGIGVHTVLGAFVAGVLVGELPILTRHIEQQLRGLVVALFMPVFFALAGLGTDIAILKDPQLLAATAGLILIASLGKFGGAFLGGAIGGLSRQECFALALGMNARGSTEVIVATIGLSIGALNGHLFTMIVTMAVVTTMIMPPTLRWALARVPMAPDEAERLEREEAEKTDFVAGLERLLVATDGTPSGRLAARLAGILGGRRGLPTTVVRLGTGPSTATVEHAASEVEASAASARAVQGKGEDGPAAPVDVTARELSSAGDPKAIAEEAAKGYDLTVVGMEPVQAQEGGFAPQVAAVVANLEGARAVVVARGLLGRDPLRGELRILVPVNGSQVSRHAAQLAFALARPTGATVTVLYVAPPRSAGNGETGARLNRSDLSRKLQASIFGDVESIAAQQDLRIRTTVRISGAAEDAILRQASRAVHTLIVMGVSARPSEAVLFGKTADAVLERAQQAVIFLAS